MFGSRTSFKVVPQRHVCTRTDSWQRLAILEALLQNYDHVFNAYTRTSGYQQSPTANSTRPNRGEGLQLPLIGLSGSLMPPTLLILARLSFSRPSMQQKLSVSVVEGLSCASDSDTASRTSDLGSETLVARSVPDSERSHMVHYNHGGSGAHGGRSLCRYI